MEGGQGEGGNGTELQAAKKNTCDNAKRGDFRNKKWRRGMDRDSGNGWGQIVSVFGRGGTKCGTGFIGETCRYCRQGCHGLAY